MSDVRTIDLGDWDFQGKTVHATMDIDVDKVVRLIRQALKNKSGQTTRAHGAIKVTTRKTT